MCGLHIRSLELLNDKEKTYWNFEPCEARIVKIIVGNSGRFEKPWFQPYLGTVREAVEIVQGRQKFYIDNQFDNGWKKVTEGKGSPTWGHSSLDAERVLDD